MKFNDPLDSQLEIINNAAELSKDYPEKLKHKLIELDYVASEAEELAKKLPSLEWGATIGQGIGLSGQTYAIPTMFESIMQIRPFIDDFIAYAKANPTSIFLVTKVGCGIAGFTPEQIAPLFVNATTLDNIFLPKEFWFWLQ